MPRDDPIRDKGKDALLAALKNKIRLASVVLVPAGVYVTHSQWINLELDIAKKGFSQPKPIVAIEPWGSERTSRRAKDEADRTVKWNAKSIVEAIRSVA